MQEKLILPILSRQFHFPQMTFLSIFFHLYPIKICVIDFDALQRKISLSVALDKATIKAANVQSQL